MTETRIADLRHRGFTTNSSASHHVIRLREEITQERLPTVPSAGEGLFYGDDDFVLRSAREKGRFIAAGAYTTYRGKYGLCHEDAATLVRAHLGDSYSYDRLRTAGHDYQWTAGMSGSCGLNTSTKIS